MVYHMDGSHHMSETQGWFLVVEGAVIALWAALAIVHARMRP